MIVTCSKCSTKFKIADEKISSAGVKVRCSKCKHTFKVTTDGVEEIDQAATAQNSSPPSSVPAGSASTSTLPPPPKEKPLPPPPKIVDTNPPPKDAIPNDIFASPTKVGPAPEGFADEAKPLPPPPPPPPPPAVKPSAFEKIPAKDSFPSLDESPTEKIPAPPAEAFGVIESAKTLPSDLVSSIDLDSDLPIVAAGALPSSSDSNIPVPPPPETNHMLSEDLFSDLDSAVDQLVPPSESESFPLPNESPGLQTPETQTTMPEETASADKPKPPEPVLPNDDPFAGIDLDIPETSASLNSEESSSPEEALPASSSEDPASSLSMDDPFSDIDLSSGSAKDLAGQKEDKADQIFGDPFASLPVEQNPQQDLAVPEQNIAQEASVESGGDLFSDLGDPFAGLNDQAPEPPPLPQGVEESSPALSSADDLFGPISSSEPSQEEKQGFTPSGGQDPSVGHDPFAALDSADSFSGEDQQLDIGMALGADGQVEGEELPSGPLPTKVLGAGEQETEAAPATVQRPPGPPPMLVSPRDELEPVGKSSFLFRFMFGAVLLAVLFFAFVAFRHGGKPDLAKWSTYVEAFTGDASAFSTKGDLQVVDVASTAFRNRDGHRLVVLWGKIRNNGPVAKKQLVVSGQLLRNNKAISKLSVPAGLVFSPEDVFSMLDGIAIKEAYVRKYEPEKSTLAPGKTLPFMVLLSEHPDNLSGLKVRVIPGQNDDPLSDLRLDKASVDSGANPKTAPEAARTGSAAGKITH